MNKNESAWRTAENRRLDPPNSEPEGPEATCPRCEAECLEFDVTKEYDGDRYYSEFTYTCPECRHKFIL